MFQLTLHRLPASPCRNWVQSECK